MLVNNLKGRNPITLFLIPILGLLLWLNSFNTKDIIGLDNSMPLYSLLKTICLNNNIALNILAFFILIANAFLLNRLNETFVFVKQRTNLPGLIYMILACSIVSIKGMQAAIPASFFIILAINRSFASYQEKNTSISSFDIGFICSIALLFHINIFPYLIWVWFIIIVLEQIKLKNIIASTIGFITPLFITASYYYITDRESLINIILKSITSKKVHTINFSELNLSVLFIFLALLCVISIAYLFTVFEDKKIRSRKYFIILFSLFVFTIAQYIVLPNTGLEIYFILIIPLSYIISHYFILQKHRYWGEIFFILLIIISLVCNYIL